MSGLSQNSSYESQAIYLEPNQNLIDGRTELDHLHFMARFASVLNFYNQANKLDGNWQPFLLKDPAILMAFISKTDLNPFKNNFEAASKGLDFFWIQRTINLTRKTTSNHLLCPSPIPSWEPRRLFF